MMGSRRRSSSRIRPTFRMMAGVARDEPPNLRTLTDDVEKESIIARRSASSWPLQKGATTEHTDKNGGHGNLFTGSLRCLGLSRCPPGSAFEETGLLLRPANEDSLDF